MAGFKKKAMAGAVKMFYAVRMLVVACVCLLIGFSARQLFDAYVPDMISHLKKNLLDAEVQVLPSPHQEVSVGFEAETGA
jgi:hypothetical protein